MNPPSVGTGFTSSPSSPEYMDPGAKDYSQERTNTRLKQGSPINPGVILSKDSLDVPLEVAFAITNDRANASRPTLLPLFRTRYVEDRQVGELTHDYYEELRNNLSVDLKNKLEREEGKPNMEDKDPDLIALNQSLRFEANLLALADSFSVPSSMNENTLIGAQQFAALPDLVKQELLSYGAVVTNFLDRYLATIGPNDPSYDLLLNVSNQIKEAIGVLAEG